MQSASERIFSQIRFLAYLLLIVLGIYFYQKSGVNLNVPKLRTIINNPIAPITYSPPSAEIEQLANQAGMTEKAKQIFYAANPQIDNDRATFDKDCQAPKVNNGIELGCYSTAGKIYILRINNSELAGQMVVVAAHEMLHAAYDQLSNAEQVKVDSALESELPILQNKELARELRSYQQTEPGERDNELHSIIGTEYPNLDQSLENYYSQYFTNRSKVVNFAEQFNNAFNGLETTILNLQSQIRQLRREMAADLKTRNIQDYNSKVPVINNLITEHNNDIVKYNQLSRSLMNEESSTQSQ